MIPAELNTMLARLRIENYFEQPRTTHDVQQALIKKGHWFTEDQIAAALDEILANQ